MGCTVREKHIRANRRPRSVKPDMDNPNLVDQRSSIAKSVIESGLRPLENQLCVTESTQDINPNPNPNPNPLIDDNGVGYFTEEQLEEILLKNLEFLYNEAISKLVGLGYDEDVALKAILKSGHCYGAMDVLSNILHNSLNYLSSGSGSSKEKLEESEPLFVNLRQLEEYQLAAMVCLLQQVKPQLTKGDAMWCLLVNDLHAGRAGVMEFPVIPSVRMHDCCTATHCKFSTVSGSQVGAASVPCKTLGGRSFGNGTIPEFPVNGFPSHAPEMTLQREIEFPKGFNLTPSQKSLLKRNVAMFSAGFRANLKQLQTQSQASPGPLSGGELPIGVVPGKEVPVQHTEELPNPKNQDVVSSMLSKFGDLNLDENMECVPEDQKDEMVLSLIHQIQDLERQVKERKDWAHQKAMQAARKLSHDLTELKMLRIEREETQRMKKGKQTLEDTTMKRLSEMETALRKASGQVDRANAAVRRLEAENAEMKAEMEASKLSAQESVKTCLEVAKREKKCLKRLLAWEKQKTKMQDEIAAEKQKISKLQQQLVQIEESHKEAEGKWRQEEKAKDLALTQVEEEQRLKEATEASNERNHEALCLKIERDFQRHKDDLQRLEQELSRLKMSAQSPDIDQSDNLTIGNPDGGRPQGETIARLLHELDKLEDSSTKENCHGRECLICVKNEVSVVFLPCAHQVLCADCNDNYGKKGKHTCPCCRAPIEQRIRVFGASS